MKTGLRIAAGFLFLFTAGIISFGVFLSKGKEPQPWHSPSPFAFVEPFVYENASFTDYIDWSERRIRASRTDAPDETVINNLKPFLLEPEQDCPVNPDGKFPDGIVLVHGLIASPWSMKPIGEFFNSRCFYVLSILLPGHGTRPGDMLGVTWEDWDDEVRYATRLLAQQVDRVYVSGHSAGGTLAVLEAARNPEVDALILFAPALKVDEASRYAGYIQYLGRFFPAASWFEMEPEDGVYRYESFPFSAAADTWDLIQETNKTLGQNPLDIPIMTIASAEDTTVDVQTTFEFMQGQEHPASFTLLYSQYTLPSYLGTSVQNSNVPEQGILSLSHLGLMTPPEHPHYGVNGDYHYCSQYFGLPNADFEQCKAGQRDFYGEITEANMGQGIIERIAFNPFYDELLREIDLFLEQVGLDQRGIPLQRQIQDNFPRNIDN
jgi:esterase/lipase